MSILSIILLILIGLLSGSIITWLFIGSKYAGTIHIENDTENSGEKYVFSFNDFDYMRTSKSVRLHVEDHTR